jgi:hypothetical protein
MNPLFKILIGLGILKKDLDYHLIRYGLSCNNAMHPLVGLLLRAVAQIATSS